MTGVYSSISGTQELKKTMVVWYGHGKNFMALNNNCHQMSFITQILKDLNAAKISHKFTKESELYSLRNEQWLMFSDPNHLQEGSEILLFDPGLMEEKLIKALHSTNLMSFAPLLFSKQTTRLVDLQKVFQKEKENVVSRLAKQSEIDKPLIMEKMIEIMKLQ